MAVETRTPAETLRLFVDDNFVVDCDEARIALELLLSELEATKQSLIGVMAERGAAEKALHVYADHRNWGIMRDEFRHPSAVWIGPGALERVPDAPKVAREALA